MAARTPYYNEFVIQLRNAIANSNRIAILGYIDENNRLIDHLIVNGTIDDNWTIFNNKYVGTIEECCEKFNFIGKIIIFDELDQKADMEQHDYHIIEITQPLF
jgi:hypothetical protein